MVNEKYSIAMTEALYYLNGINENDLNKIPKKFLKFLKDNSSKSYKCNFDYTKSLRDLNLSNEARGIIAMICLNYWCDTEEKKEQFKKHLQKNEAKYQEELRKKYNPDDLFKKRPFNTNISKSENLSIIKYETSFFKKIKNWLKQIFKNK